MLGDVDALAAQLTGLPGGEVQLHGGRAPLGHLLAQFMTVGACLDEQRHLCGGDLRVPDGQAVLAAAPALAGLGDGRRQSGQQQ